MTKPFCFIRAAVLAAAAALTSPLAWAQHWEVGGAAGASFSLDRTVRAATGATGQVGFARGIAGSGWIAHNSAGRLGGEIRYLFARSDMRLTGNGVDYRFAARSHLVHYDVLIHANSGEDRIRPFVAIGGGLKGYFGAGAERAVQPLSNLAILSRTSQWKPLLSVGGGVKWTIGQRWLLRAEVRDYITPIPREVILPAPGATISGWIHDIVPMVGISYLFP
jgi:hypothetical protein